MKYFDRLERVHERVSISKRKSDELLLKNFYYDLYVIKEEDIPESYFLNQVRIARERGYGNIEINPQVRKQMCKQVIDDQKESLDKWIEYFLYDEESKSYEMWEKYWVFQGLQSLGKYNKETGKFSKRDKTTVYPFPPVEREYVFTTLKLMEDYIKDKRYDDEIKSILGSGNFKLLYEYVIIQSLLKGEKQSNSIEGKWVKYDQGSDYNKLRDSLQGYYTGWCTAAGENFEKMQLDSGDFYVYYSLDKDGNAKVPRIAIRMEGTDKIGEIRGIADNQNMEEEMLPILNEKLKCFPDRDKYYKKENDMRLLTLIDNKVNNNIKLNVDELRFLYEIDSRIEGFGYDKDPRIDEIKGKRDKRKDYSFIYNVAEDEVALTQEEFKNNPKKYKVLIDDLDLREVTNATSLVLPEVVFGNLVLCELRDYEGLVLPQMIGGDLYLNELTEADGLKLPQRVDGSLYLNNLVNANGLIFPQSVGKSLYFDELTNGDGLVLPQSVGWDLNLNKLTDIKNVVFPKHIGENLSLHSLKNAKDVVFPQSIGESLDLTNLMTAENLMFPRSIGGDLFLNSLTDAKELKFPQSISGSLALCNLNNGNDLILPQSIGEDLYLNNLSNAKGLIFPQSVGKNVYLQSLKSAKGLALPQKIGRCLILDSLTSARDLKLPYGFNLNNLYCANNIKRLLIFRKNKYYMSNIDKEEVSHKRR